MKKKKQFNTSMWLFIILILSVILVFISQKYKYNKCVSVNNDELKKCQVGKYGNYDCSTFENAEEKCSMLLEVNN